MTQTGGLGSPHLGAMVDCAIVGCACQRSCNASEGNEGRRRKGPQIFVRPRLRSKVFESCCPESFASTATSTHFCVLDRAMARPAQTSRPPLRKDGAPHHCLQRCSWPVRLPFNEGQKWSQGLHTTSRRLHEAFRRVAAPGCPGLLRAAAAAPSGATGRAAWPPPARRAEKLPRCGAASLTGFGPVAYCCCWPPRPPRPPCSSTGMGGCRRVAG